MARDFKSKTVELIHRQLTFSPAAVRKNVIFQAEQFIPGIDDQKEYPYDFIVHKLTRHRPEEASEEVVSGAVLRKDLGRMLDMLADTVDITPEELNDEVLDVQQVASMFNVSAKTVYRWNRDRGLLGYRVRFDDKQKKLAVRKTNLDEFVRENHDLVKEARSFTKLTDTERDTIIARARELAEGTELGFCEVTRTISKDIGRAAETVRMILKKHDADNPERPIFPEVTPPIDEENAQRIVELYRDGESLKQIAKKYNRNKSTIHRILHKYRANELMTMPLKVVFHEDFDKRNYRDEIASRDLIAEFKEANLDPKVGKHKNPLRNDKSIPTYFADLFNSRILSRDQEGQVFKAYNYYKYRVDCLRKKLKGYTPSASVVNQIETFYNKSVELKKFIVASNLRLVVSIAKKHLGPNIDFAKLISDGNLSLIKAVDTFDFSRGNRFSTYASWAVMKNYARSVPEENYRLKQFQPTEPEIVEEARRNEAEEMPHYEFLKHVRSGLLGVIERLDDREREIVINRFGLNKDDKSYTLEDIGNRFSLSKERIRQIEAKALIKMREIIETEEVDLMPSK